MYKQCRKHGCSLILTLRAVWVLFLPMVSGWVPRAAEKKSVLAVSQEPLEGVGVQHHGLW